tara:strand:- start:3526 stop:4257 length:732 start_codon:yes stop_codon:yes gene_type:complete
MSCKKCLGSKCTCQAAVCENPLLYAVKEAISLVGTTCTDAKIPTEYAAIIEQGTAPTVPFTHTIDSAMISVLLNGISISNNKNICCPDCDSGVYFIGDSTEITDFLNKSATHYSKICCLEHESSVAIWKTLQTFYETLSGNAKIQCCNTDFKDKLSQWVALSESTNAYFNLDTLLNAGTFEASSFNLYSGLGIILDYLQLNQKTLTATDYLNILGIILKLGFVVNCESGDCNIQISAMKTYLL